MSNLPVSSLPCADNTLVKRSRHATKRITLRQAENMMAAVAFAREIGLPLNAHATIHWVGTEAGDDPDGSRFAKVREGFDKWLKRQGIPGGLTAIWVRERLSGGSAEVVHCHMLFHLAHPFLGRRKRLQVERALERLIDRHGRGNYANYTLKLTFPRNPNGLYLLKGGGRDVWNAFGVPKTWRKGQGLIVGKRCGTTENIGPAARQRRRNGLNQIKEAVVGALDAPWSAPVCERQAQGRQVAYSSQFMTADERAHLGTCQPAA